MLRSRAMLLALLASLLLQSSPRCDVTLRADGNTAAIQAALERTDTPTICLKPGRYVGARFVATHSARLRRLGQGEVLLDAGGQGRVLTMPQAHVRLQLDGLTLTGGNAAEGGAIALTADAELTLTDCVIRDNVATFRNGGGLWANAGRLVALRTRWVHNQAEAGAALALGGTARALVVANLVTQHPALTTNGTPVHLAQSSALDVVSTTIAYNAGPCIAIAPDLNEKPQLRVQDSLLLGAPDSFRIAQRQAEAVDVQRSVVSGHVGFVSLDLASRRDPPQLDALGTEKAMPALGSPAIDLARCASADQRRDLRGAKRGKKCAAGALEPPNEIVAHTRWLRKHKK